MDTSGQRENVLYPGTFSSREQRNIKLKGVNNWNKLKRNKLKEKKLINSIIKRNCSMDKKVPN